MVAFSVVSNLESSGYIDISVAGKLIQVMVDVIFDVFFLCVCVLSSREM